MCVCAHTPWHSSVCVPHTCTKCPPLTPRHVLPSRGKRLSQMGGEMLNFPADDLAVLFTPHLWPSVTFHTVAVSTWPVHTGCKGMVAGLEGRDSVLSSQLRSLGSASCPRTDLLGAALGDGSPVGDKFSPELSPRIAGVGESPKCLGLPQTSSDLSLLPSCPLLPYGDLQPEQASP